MMKIKCSIFTVLVLAIVLCTTCKKDTPPNTVQPPPAAGGVNITGVVKNENNAAISGASVKCEGAIATTNSSGEFTLTNVPVLARNFVTVSSPNYFDAYRGVVLTPDLSSYIKVTMVSKGAAKNFKAASGSLISDQGGNINIPSNSLADANGNAITGDVTAYLRFQGPGQSNFGEVMQGGDFAGVNASQQAGVLESYGFYTIELEDANGKQLNIKSGAAATFTMPIDPDQLSTAPATIDLWTFDKTSGIWKQEGLATKIGNVYVGQVTHFSEWNCDSWNTTAEIKGKVVCNGTAVTNAKVQVANGKKNKIYVYTNSNGEFKVKIPSGFTSTITVDKMGPLPIKILSKDEVFDIGIKDQCSGLTGLSTFTLGQVSYSNLPQYCGDDGSGKFHLLETRDPNTDNYLSVYLKGPRPTTAASYSIVTGSVYQSSVSGVAVFYLGQGENVEYASTGGGLIAITLNGGKLTATFSNIPVVSNVTTSTVLVSGSLVCP